MHHYKLVSLNGASLNNKIKQRRIVKYMTMGIGFQETYLTVRKYITRLLEEMYIKLLQRQNKNEC